MTASWELVLALSLPFLGSVVLRLFPGDRTARGAGIFATLVSAGALVLLLPDLLAIVARPGTAAGMTATWIPTLDVTFALRLDGLAALFALLVAGIGTVVFAYATGYMEGHERLGAFFAAMLAFQGSMLGVVLADDVLLLFLFWELTSLTSFLLIGYHRDEADSVYSARKAMIITVSGGVTMFVGLLVLAWIGGTFRISELLAGEAAGPLAPVAMGLIVAGAASKAAQFPLHIWLPNAMVAPTPVSSYLHSAAMVKAGIFVVARFRPAFAHLVSWQVLVTGLGLVTMLLTAVLALGQRDPKKLLAYSTCSQLGLIVAALGLPGAGAGGLLHVAHHAVFKCGLFLAAGVAIHAFHAETMDQMGGLQRLAPVTGVATLALALASAGLPLFSGFVSKEVVLESAIALPGSAAWATVALLAVASMFTVAYSIRFFEGIFLGSVPEGTEAHVPDLLHRGPVLLLGGLAILGGLVPGLWDGLTNAARAAVAPDLHAVHLALWHGPTPGLAVTAVIVVGGVYLWHRHERFVAFVDRLREQDPLATADHLYHALLDHSQRSAFRVGRIVQRETPQTYVAYTVVGAAALLLGGLAWVGASIPVPPWTGQHLVLLVAVLIGVSALTVTRAKGYTVGIIALGAVGLLIGLLYLLLGAPDVGLTQLLVETLLLALFVAVIARLPPTYLQPPKGRQLRDAAVAVFVGAAVFAAVAVAAPPGAFPTVGEAYLRNVVEATGGHNAVNVILVDFRALDTLGEITVVAIAGLAGITLIQGRFRGWMK